MRTATSRRFGLALAMAFALGLTGCAGGDSDKAKGGDSDNAKGKATPAVAEPGPPDVKLVDSGFGQDEYGVRGIVIATSNRASSVGQFVVAKVKFIDADGALLGTGEQTETFDWAGQELVLVVQPDTVKYDASKWADIAEIDVSLTITNEDEDVAAAQPLATIDVPTIEELGSGVGVQFEYTNSTDASQTGTRFGIICYDAADKIIGGELAIALDPIAPGESATIDETVYASATPERCSAYPGHPASEYANP